jgi:hypothetical protein
MKTFNTFLFEEDDDDSSELEAAKKALVLLISSNMARFLSKTDKQDNTPLLMFIAALQLVNTATDVQSLTVARRMATAALAKSVKK